MTARQVADATVTGRKTTRVPTATTAWQRHISKELAALRSEIATERDLRQKREQEEGEKRVARRATDPVIEQIHARQEAEAQRAQAGRQWLLTLASGITMELATLAGQRLVAVSEMHTATIAGSALSVLTAVGVYLKQRRA